MGTYWITLEISAAELAERMEIPVEVLNTTEFDDPLRNRLFGVMRDYGKIVNLQASDMSWIARDLPLTSSTSLPGSGGN